MLIESGTPAIVKGAASGLGETVACKGGVVAMMLPTARDLADKGIRVVSIAPGIFATPMVSAFPQTVQNLLAVGIPFPEYLERTGEFAEPVLHITQNGLPNGEVLRLDGAVRMAPR